MKKAAGRIIAIALCFIMVIQTMVIGGFSFLASASTGVLYQTDFSTDFNSLKASGLWDVETDQRNDGNAPTLNGAMVMDTKDSVKFNWTSVDGVGAYSTEMVYTFDFDVKVTDEGNGNKWTGPDHTRILYAAFGGWYNQVEINNKDGKLRAGDNLSVNYNSNTFKNKTVHVKLSLQGTTATTIITDSNGAEIAKGTRSNGDYSNMTQKIQSTDVAPAMTYLVIRCEDG